MPTTQPPHSRDYISLREYIDTLLEARDKETDRAYQSMEKRLEGMNEFRDALKDQSSTYLTKSEYKLAHDRILDDIRGLRESRAELHGKASQKSVDIAMILGVISLLVGLIGLVSGILK